MNGTSVTFRVQVHMPPGVDSAELYIRIGKRVTRTTITSDATRDATFDTEWTVAPTGSAEAAAGAIPLTKRVDDIRIGLGTGAKPGHALDQQQVEAFSYRLDRSTGNIELVTPSRKFDGHRTPDGLAFHERREVRNLDVQVTTNREPPAPS